MQPPENQADLTFRLTRAIREYQNASDIMDEAFTALLGINRTDGRCLDIIDLHGHPTAGQLAAESGLTTGTVTAVVDRLEKAGYVRRRRDPGDRRKVVVEATETAQELGTLVFDEVGRLGQALMGRMTPEQLLIVIRFLEVGNRMSREMAALLSKHVPSGASSPEDRRERARAFHREQKAMVRRLEASFGPR
ncbi:MarR family winged helix-turn-helix transcriptional regulator [Solirhodobacter olei]|uniref:MarR family winged helix-turn-helix transcriptional regulator n=1 Tax=Solirhodobacter olei TaxID=2493082 RepID=UPI001F4D44F0|nr:MarR family transcriptional regulator [Solirhodobacter olei]